MEGKSAEAWEKLVLKRTGAHTRAKPYYLGIELKSWTEELYEAAQVLGMEQTAVLMARAACQVYESAVGEGYLLPEKTLAFEIRYHAEGYLYAVGKKEYFLKRHITTWAFPKKMLERRCEVIDIYYNGTTPPFWKGGFWEAILFGYPKK